MSVRKPTEAHKATMRRHYSESVAAGVSVDEIHRELHDLVFAQTGKYSMNRITATTSWIAGQILSGRRVNDIVWDEGPNDTNEDVNFDNPEKNGSREWHVEKVLKHTTAEMRRSMRYALMPGRNVYDLEAFVAAGLDARNFLTFMLGEDPKSVAEYIRNARK